MRRRSSALRLLAGAAFLAALAGSALSAEPGPRGKAAGSGPDLYAAEPEPLTVAECGRCHPSHFGALKKNGGRHRFDCRDCHQIFHAYNPRKANYAEIMPRCADCHGVPHGDKQTACLTCHVDPHAPVRSPPLPQLAAICGDCHSGPPQQLKAAPSAHTKQACDACHSQRHGRVPGCSECHKPHFEAQPLASCARCHPAHRPLETAFTAETDAKTCQTCHEDAFRSWSGTRSKHGKVNCTVCHTRHRFKPECTTCHPKVHSPQMLARFPTCLACHLDVHDPPTR